MPASEKTWRDQKTLHVVFGCTGLLLLISTVWMFGADHTREWKRYQRQMRNVDVRLTQWRMAGGADSGKLPSAAASWLMHLTETTAGPPPQAAFDQFVGRCSQDENTAEASRETMYDRMSADGTSEAERKRLRTRLDDQTGGTGQLGSV